jgi:predicted  nucleic acid-binding Zn-ribbon protein
MRHVSTNELSDEVARMRAELEQALVTAEDAQQEVTRLSQEVGRLAQENRELREQLATSRAYAASPAGAATTKSLSPPEPPLARLQLEEALRAAMEELTVMAEELERANEVLRQDRPSAS